MTNNLEEEIAALLFNYRMGGDMDEEDLVKTILTLINQKEKEARIDELNSLQIYEDGTLFSVNKDEYIPAGEFLEDRIKQLKEELNKGELDK